MKPGDLVILLSHVHGYPPGWKMGDDIVRFTTPELVIVLAALPETDLIDPPVTKMVNPRIFFRVLSSKGVVDINSAFCDACS